MNYVKEPPSVTSKSKKTTPRRLLRTAGWFLLGFVPALTGPWLWYLNGLVNDLVEDPTPRAPASVFARPLELHVGRTLSAEALQFELDLLGYRAVDHAPEVGQYRRRGAAFEIHSKGFAFVDGVEAPRHFRVRIENARVVENDAALARLEPLLLGQLFADQWRGKQPVRLAQLPDTLVRGLQAVEDRDFKHHAGVDFLGIARALVRNLRAGRLVEGGSTLTQQLIKNRWQYSDKSWLRKLNEAAAALLLERKLGKGEILTLYFNDIYWGQDGKVAIHGVEQAAQFYFAKPAAHINIAEQALLVALIKGPSWYNPYKNTERAVARQELVLKVWWQTGVISEAEYRQAVQHRLNLHRRSPVRVQYGDFLDLVKRQLHTGFSGAQLQQQGLRVFTTLDPWVQWLVEKTAAQSDELLGADLQNAVVVSHASSGEVLAISGAKDSTSHFNRALLSRRQIGSLIKPLVYLAGLELMPGFSLNSAVQDRPLEITVDRQSVWRPDNWDGESLGTIQARTALVQSRNQATVYLGQQIGLARFIAFLKQLGLEINRANHPSIFLGAIDLTPFEVHNLFLLFSSSGRVQQAQVIRAVTDAQGRLLRRGSQQRPHAVKATNIERINQALGAITREGTAQALSGRYALRQPLFGKTGTTNRNRDSWFVGFDREVLASVWVGRDDNAPTSFSGARGAMVLWAQLFKNLQAPQ